MKTLYSFEFTNIFAANRRLAGNFFSDEGIADDRVNCEDRHPVLEPVIQLFGCSITIGL